MQHHFHVREIQWEKSDFASSHLGTPDSLREERQELMVHWYFPEDLLKEQLTLECTVHFFGGKEELFLYPISSRFGSKSFSFPSQNKLLTYRLRAIAESGEIVDNWEHQFWTKLISLDR
ncbi:MAG: hypothetical protein KGI80_02105 [Verrucomicrobiota bacterium]|nr:hypothetical protein [Verrucomicrobiota bacterium]